MRQYLVAASFRAHLCPVDSMLLISVRRISASSTIDSRIPIVYWTEMAVSPKVGDAGPLAMHHGSAIGVFFGSSNCQNKLGWLPDLEMQIMATTMTTREAAAVTMVIPMTGLKCRAMFLTRKTMATNINVVSHDYFAAYNEEGGEADRQRYHVYMPPHSDGAGTTGTIPLHTRPRFIS